MVTPWVVEGMGMYEGTGASRPIASCRGESGTGVEAMIMSLRAQTLGCSRGETANTSSDRGGGSAGGGVGRPMLEDRSSRSSRTWETWCMGRKR